MATFFTSAVKLHAVMRDPEPMASGDSVLKRLECLVLKFNNPSAIQTNQVIVVAPFRGGLISGLSISKFSLGGQTQSSEQFEGTIDGDVADLRIGLCNLRINLGKAFVPGRIEKNSKDLFPLLCRLQPFAGNACSKEAVLHYRSPDFEIEFQFHITHFVSFFKSCFADGLTVGTTKWRTGMSCDAKTEHILGNGYGHEPLPTDTAVH